MKELRFLAQRDPEHGARFVEDFDWTTSTDGLMTILVGGHGDLKGLALRAAANHFKKNPDRTHVIVEVKEISSKNPWIKR